MTSINLVFRPSTSLKPKAGSLALRLIHKRQVKTITLKGCRIFPEEWDKVYQQLIYSATDTSRNIYLEKVNRIIQQELELLERHLQELEMQGDYTVCELATIYCLKKNENKLFGFADKLAQAMERSGQLRTARAYRTVAKGLVDFNKGVDIPLKHINSCILKDFENYLKNKGRLPNTISYYMRNLRAIYNKAITHKYICRPLYENPFTGTYTGVTKTMKRSLSLKELQKISGIDFTLLLQKAHQEKLDYKYLSDLEKSQRYFLFSFYARGMSFVDMAYLKKDNISGGFIRYVRKKTGRQMEIRITPEIHQIINSFKKEVEKSLYVFPLITDTETNRMKECEVRFQYESALRVHNNRLKKISQLAEISKPISSHWARHTWATIGKQENIPLQVLSECLGHSSEKTTLIYLGQLDNSLLDAANQLISSAVNKQASSLPLFYP